MLPANPARDMGSQDRPRPVINVGVMVAHTPARGAGDLRVLADRVVADAAAVLSAETGADWRFHSHEEPLALRDDEPRRPSDFLDEATLRMAEAPYDAFLVVTDAALVSRMHRVVSGLASPPARIMVMSTRRLRMAPRGHPPRALHEPPVRWNGGALLLHLAGRLLRLPHPRGGGAMAPFAFDPARDSLPRFAPGRESVARRRAAALPERRHRGTGLLGTLGFHLASAARNPGAVLWPLLRNRALLLPLFLPRLLTAAVAPSLILVFTAEIWDVGLNMRPGAVWGFSAATILAAAWYLAGVQNLFYPRREKRVVAEHMAVVNVAVFLTLLFAAAGLWGMVGLLSLAIETLVFPERLISTWPTLGEPVVDTVDKLRLAAFISNVGVLTGTLAGGLESRAVIRHLALFDDEP